MAKSANRGVLTFDEDTHTYRLDGKRMSSVTQIIGQFRRVYLGDLVYLVDVFSGQIFPAETFDDPAEIGTAIHKGCAMLLQGKRLNWDGMNPALVEPLKRFQEWLDEICPQPVLVEKPMASAYWGFAGAVDMVVDLFGGRGVRYLIDIKTGGAGMAGPQTAAYEKLYREQFGWTGKLKRAVLDLPKDGKHCKLKIQKNKGDWEFFKSRLVQHEFLKGKTGLRHK